MNTTLFRVHYSLTSLAGLQRHSEDVTAVSPDAAAAIIVARQKPRPVAITKVKRVKEASHG